MKIEVIVPTGIDQHPESHEISAAEILLTHFRAPIYFLQKRQGYKQPTPDISVRGEEWEIKSPKSRKMSKVNENISEALNQSSNVVLDTRRTPIGDERIIGFINRKMKNRKRVTGLIVIDKHSRVTVFKKPAKNTCKNKK